MKTYIASLCIAGLALAGTAVAGPNNGPKNQVQGNKPNIVNQAKPNFVNPAIQQNQPKLVASPKVNPQFKLTKFNNSNKIANYNLLFGKSFAFGIFYPGKHHQHWTSYWDPCLRMYYYWCEADQCFYPVSYATTCVPTLNVPLIEVNVTVNNTNTSGNSNAVTGAPATTPTTTPVVAPVAAPVGTPVTVATANPNLMPVGFELPEPPAE
jgi:hypothetical protein